jgi:hypothetical protein
MGGHYDEAHVQLLRNLQDLLNWVPDYRLELSAVPLVTIHQVELFFVLPHLEEDELAARLGEHLRERECALGQIRAVERDKNRL